METSSSALPRAFGPFTLLHQIGQGGMGQVFLALRPIAGRAVDEVCVVKTVRGDLKNEREAVGRFLDEARVVQKLGALLDVDTLVLVGASPTHVWGARVDVKSGTVPKRGSLASSPLSAASSTPPMI